MVVSYKYFLITELIRLCFLAWVNRTEISTASTSKRRPSVRDLPRTTQWPPSKSSARSPSPTFNTTRRMAFIAQSWGRHMLQGPNVLSKRNKSRNLSGRSMRRRWIITILSPMTWTVSIECHMMELWPSRQRSLRMIRVGGAGTSPSWSLTKLIAPIL